MGLEQYVIAFVTFVNNLVIPFLMGLAFLFFVINAFRFFVVGGANADGREKARSLAVYGLLAFVLIFIFWGIINLLTNSLGLQALGERTARCFDYECGPTASQQTNGGANVGGNFGSTGIGDPRGADIGSPGSGFGTSPDVTLPDFGSDTPPNTSNPGSQPTQPSAPAGATEFSAFVSTENAIKPVADNFVRTQAPDLFGRHTGNITSELFADLPNASRDTANFSDIERAQAAMRLAIIGAISDAASLQYQTQLEDYYEAVSPGYYQGNIAPSINTITRDVPPTVQTNFSQTTSLIENELTTYYSSAGLGLTSAQISQSVEADLQTLSEGSTDDRMAALEDLYDQNILRDPDNVIYDQFSEDLNVINIYDGIRPDF